MNLERYRQLCQKNESENYLLDKYIFRKISIYVTILFIRLNITPNQATFLSLLACLGSLYFLLFHSAGMLIIAALLIFTYYILDHVDGELARYYIQTGRMKPSLSGHYFDVLVHRYSSNIMVLFLGLGIYRQLGYESAVLLGFIACIGISSFPNVIAAQVIAGKIANDRDVVFHQPEMNRILLDIEKKSQQIQEIHGGSLFQKAKKLMIELFFFPGHIVLLILALLGDALLGNFVLGGQLVNFRLLFLLVMAFIYTAKTVAQSILWINKLKNLA